MRREIVEGIVLRRIAQEARHAWRIRHQPLRVHRTNGLNVIEHALRKLVPDLDHHVAVRHELTRDGRHRFVFRLRRQLHAVVPALLRKKHDLHHHAQFIRIRNDGFQRRDVLVAQAPIEMVERFVRPAVDEASFVVPLPPNAQHVHAILLELRDPALPLLGALVERRIVDGVEKADPRVRKRLCVQQESRAGNRQRVLRGQQRSRQESEKRERHGPFSCKG